MTKKIFAAAIFVCAVFIAGAQEKQREYPYTLGAGIEGNLNTREGYAMGYALGIDRYVFPDYFILGIRGMITTDMKSVTDMEAGIYARFNWMEISPGPIQGHLFSQFGWGVSFFREDANQPVVMYLNYAMGYRMFFLKGFYAEPYITIGWPTRFGFGLMAGHWFDF